eukprot:3686570-Prymnesium_polylepis.1
MQQVAEQGSEGEDDEDWEELREQKIEQLHSMLRTLDPRHCAEHPGAVHPEDETELKLFFRQQRGVAAWRVVSVLTPLLLFVDGLREPDPLYTVPPEDSQQSTESQLEQEMLDDENRSQTPEWKVSQNRRGEQRLEEPDSLERLRAPPGTFGSDAGSSPRSAPGSGAASSSGQHRAPAARRVGRPPQLAADGAEAMEGVKAVCVMAHKAPKKASTLLDEMMAAAPEATSHGSVLAKSKVVAESIFE